jgi:hypothetical protein
MSFMTLWKKKLTPLLLAAFAAGGVPQTPAIAMNPTPVSDEVPLTRDILRTGQKLLMTSLSRLPGIGMGGLVSVNIQIKSIADFGSSESRAVLEGIWNVRQPAKPQPPRFVKLGNIGTSVPDAGP